MKNLSYVKSADEEIFKYFERLGFERKDGNRMMGKYDVRISWTDRSLLFGEEDNKDKSTLILSNGSTLIVIDSYGKTIISDKFGLKKITKIFGSIEHYPCVVFEWIGWNKSEQVRKGALTSVRAMLGDTKVVNYEKKDNEEGFISSKLVADSLSFSSFPKKLEEAKDILGIEIKINIDFDKEIDETIKNSGLEKFLEELNSLAIKKPILM